MAKKQFQAESQRLLDLMINSIYTHKEIFLRELISNASDAIDKLAYRALTDDQVGLSREDFAITLRVDKEHRTLTVSDNGIGMTAGEMEQNLGTIARSGSLQFKKELGEQSDVDIIGQFGVGFYAAFMVADNVSVLSRKYGEEGANLWQSDGAEGYEITPCERAAAGTDVILHLKDDSEDEKYSDYLEEYTLRNLVRKYSDYIRYPIQMEVTRTREVEDPEDKEKKTTEEYQQLDTLNSMVPLWQRPKNEVTQEEYDRFYQEKFYDFEKPVLTLHLAAEGAVSFHALLFVPAKAPYDYYTKDYQGGLQLYSSGVMIMEHCGDLLPDYFRFVRGVVDTQDLSLNISREMLQHTRSLKLIAANLQKRIRAELLKLLENDREKYETFWSAFGLQLKYGLAGDFGANKETLRDLMIFWSAKENKYITLNEYVAAMGEEQKYIYYATGENRAHLAQLPQCRQVRDRGYDVLMLTDEVDEFVVQILQNHQDKPFRSITAEDLGLNTADEDKALEETAEKCKPVLEFVKAQLGDRVKEVRLGKNLGDCAVSLVPDGSLSFEMEKYFARVQPENAPKAGRILELNPSHDVFAALQVAMAKEPDKAIKYAELLYDQALLIAGLPLEDPSAYTTLVCSLMN